MRWWMSEQERRGHVVGRGGVRVRVCVCELGGWQTAVAVESMFVVY